MTNLIHQVNARVKRRGLLEQGAHWLQERLRAAWRSYQWLLMALLWLCALWLGYAGLLSYMRGTDQPASALDVVYLALQLVTLESGAIVGPIPWQLEIARFALPGLAAWTAIRALALVFREQTQWIALRFMRDHVVICGLSQMGLLLANRLLSNKEKVVLLVQDETNPRIEPCRSMGAIVRVGDLMDPNLLRQAALRRARLLIAVSEDDGVNAGVAVQAQKVRSLHRGKPLVCILHIVEPRLYDLLKENEIYSHQFPSLRLMLFNVYDHGARVMLEQADPTGIALQAGNGARRVLIVGMGNLGESLLLHLARSWFDGGGEADDRLRIDVVDAIAKQKCDALHLRYPDLSHVCDLVPWTMQFESPDFVQGKFLMDPTDDRTPDAAFVCVDDDTLGLYAGLALHQNLRHTESPILIRMRQQSGLAMLLGMGDAGQKPYANVHAFDLYARTCMPETLLGGTHERLAEAFYREYVHQLQRSGQTDAAAQAPPWGQLDEEEREANRKQVDRFGIILDLTGYDLAVQRAWGAKPHEFTPGEIEAMAKMEHERWCDDLRRSGWRYAPGGKDGDRKTHPLLVPWESLPEEEKEKNRNPLRELPPLLDRVGYKLVQRTPGG